MSPWWGGFAAAQTTVTCGDATHRLRWEEGELRALDHEDVEGERTLASLAGERQACLDVLDAWSRHADDLRVLTLASRGPTDALAPQETWPGAAGQASFGPIASGWTGYAPLRLHGRRVHGGAPAPPEDALIGLLGLGGGLQERLVATVAAAWEQRLERPDNEVARVLPRLHAAVYGRATATLRIWLGQPQLEVDLELGNVPALTERDGRIHAELPFAWLAGVWARGLGTIWGRFCLAATSADGERWTLSTVGPDLGAPGDLTLELRAAP